MRRTGYASNNGISYMLGDQLGSTSVIVGQNGTAQATNYYYPFGGNRGGAAFSDLTAKRFTGQYHEKGLPGGEGLSYYGARWYDAQLGRFASADTIVPDPSDPQSLNRFSYVRNHPTGAIDPSGHGDCNVYQDKGCWPPCDVIPAACGGGGGGGHPSPPHHGGGGSGGNTPPPGHGSGSGGSHSRPPRGGGYSDNEDYGHSDHACWESTCYRNQSNISMRMPIVIKSSVKTSSSGAYCGLIYLRTCDYHSISISSVVAVTFTWDSDGNWYLSGGLAPRTPSVSLNFGVIDDPSTKPKTFLKGYALNANVSIGIVGGETMSSGTGFAHETGIGLPGFGGTATYTFLTWNNNGTFEGPHPIQEWPSQFLPPRPPSWLPTFLSQFWPVRAGN